MAGAIARHRSIGQKLCAGGGGQSDPKSSFAGSQTQQGSFLLLEVDSRGGQSISSSLWTVISVCGLRLACSLTSWREEQAV